MNVTLRSRIQSSILLPLAAVLLLAPTGCNIVGPIALMVEGPPKVDAQYQLERDRHTVIFVDDPAGVLPRPALRLMMAEEAQKILLSEKELKQVIDAKSAVQIASADKAGKMLSMVELAKAVDAEIMIYIVADAFSLSADGQSYSPTCSMRVKVLDVTKPEPRVWPPEREGAPFVGSFRQKTSQVPSSRADIASAENELARQCGKAIAQLFFSHEVTGSASQGR
jgi:hypothetical protein